MQRSSEKPGWARFCFHIQLSCADLRLQQRAQAAHNRDLVALRTIRLNAFAQAEKAHAKTCDDELELVRLVLQNVDIQRQREEELVDNEFKARNQQRWDEINAAIAHLEQLQSAAEAQKVKQIQAELEARARRQEEETKIQKEREQQEQEEKKKKEEKEEMQREQARNAAEERAKNEKAQAEGRVGVNTGASEVLKPSVGSTVALPSGDSSSEDAKRTFERWHAKIRVSEL